MQYFKLFPWTDGNAYIEWTQFDQELVHRIINGEKIEEVRFDRVWLKNVSKPFPDLMGTGSSEWFVTDKFRAIIESMESPENIRFIHGVFTRKPKHYNFVNLLNNIDCFDWENSEYTTREGNPKAIKKIQKLAIKEDIVNGRNIFRIQNRPVEIYISQKLKDAMEAEGITGYTLKNISYDIVTT